MSGYGPIKLKSSVAQYNAAGLFMLEGKKNLPSEMERLILSED